MSNLHLKKLLFFFASLVTGATVASADGPDVPKGQAELQAAVRSLMPHETTDTAAIDLHIVGVHYRIPRNYIIAMDNPGQQNHYMVTLRVNMIDLMPVSNDNRACFDSNPSALPPGCEPLEFQISEIGPPTAEQAFQNSRGTFASQKAEPGPSGFELYKTGNGPNRAEYYRIFKYGRISLYLCQIFPVHGRRGGFCHPVSDSTPSGPALHYFFSLTDLPNIPEIDNRLRDLVESFVVSKENSK